MNPISQWQVTGEIDPQNLNEARLQLHFAIQFIAATGLALATPQPDYSHMSLAWDRENQIFVGQEISATSSFQIGLDPINLVVKVLDRKQTMAEFPLNGKNMAAGLAWLQGEISKLGAEADKVVWIDYPKNDFPYDFAIASGAPFNLNQQSALQELTKYFVNASFLLKETISSTPEATPVHIWPHHFDIATQLSLPGLINGEATSIGVGLSPGDSGYSEPYWYVTPWPYPDLDNLPALSGGGFWHTQHWVGAVLTASNLAQDTSQETQVKEFLNDAIAASKNLIKTR